MLFAVFAAGGVLAPSVHEAHHGLERAEALAAAAAHAASGHHHHTAGNDAHGPEAQPTCPEAPHLALDCAVCPGLTSALAYAAEAAPAPNNRLGRAALAHAPPASQPALAASVRGPPQV